MSGQLQTLDTPPPVSVQTLLYGIYQATTSGSGGSGTITGGGTIATQGYTLTVPATGTAALLGVANVFGANQSIGSAFTLDWNSDLYIGRSAAAILQLGVNHATTPTTQTIVSHSVTTGVGANMIIGAGSGSSAGGNVILATRATTGSLTNRIDIQSIGEIYFYGIASNILTLSEQSFGDKRIGLYGGVAVAQPVRINALTDNSGGTSGGNTIASIGDGTTSADANRDDTRNAIATLAAKINAIEAVLSTAAGGIGITA